MLAGSRERCTALVRNRAADPARPYGAREREILGGTRFERAWQAISNWPGYAPTPLYELAGLACGESSPLAWDILRCGADAFMSIPDTAAIETMRLLANPRSPDTPVVGGESGVAGIAGLISVAGDDDARDTLRLGRDSRIFVIGTEGDTDPGLYERIVGRSADAVHSMR